MTPSIKQCAEFSSSPSPPKGLSQQQNVAKKMVFVVLGKRGLKM